MKHYTIPIFIPELACPFQCIYCNQRIISGQASIPSSNEILQTIEGHLASFKQDAKVQLGFFGGNFTGIDFDTQKELLSLVQPYLETDRIHAIRLSTRPDYISEEVLEVLKEFHVTTIELGVQSLDTDVLRLCRRGYGIKTVEKAARLIKGMGFDLGMQMMIGLPGDTKKKSLETAQKIIDFGASNTRIYPTLVVRNTELEQIYKQGAYKPLSLEEAIDWTKDILQLFEQHQIVVLRTGLHPSEGFISGEDFEDGPFHVSFKELVLSRIWRDLLSAKWEENFQDKVLTIFVNPKEINYAIGYNACNRLHFAPLCKNISFKADTILLGREFRIEGEE